MFFCFECVERDGYLFPEPGTKFFSASNGNLPPYLYSIHVETFPEFFEEVFDKKNGRMRLKDKLHDNNFENTPYYRFDPGLYREGKCPFIPIDVFSCDFMSHAIRRNRINRDITKDFTSPNTEIKKLRKALFAIIQILTDPSGNDLSHSPAILDFLTYNAAIETRIKRYPKESLSQLTPDIVRKIITGRGHDDGRERQITAKNRQAPG